jgi:DeoR/GlpR family transcriptional regulator of sugar metabolism
MIEIKPSRHTGSNPADRDLMKNDRLSAIREHLYKHGTSSIQAIADSVGASLATIRRDLQVLEEEGVVSRDHGSARIATTSGTEVAFELREKQNLFAKRAIAAAAFEMIRPNAAIFLDAGTTVLQVARQLRLNPMPLSVFTNCLTVAQVLMDVPQLKITMLGGQLRPENASVTGGVAEAMLERLWFDNLFLGAGAIADDGCIYSLDESEARLNEKMLSRAATATLLADSSKFDQRLTYKVAPLARDLKIISDDGLPAGWADRLVALGCDLKVVSTQIDGAQVDASRAAAGSRGSN